MDIHAGEIMSRAYNVVIKYRVLWALGLVAALLSITGDSNFHVGEGRLRIFNVDVEPTPELVAWVGSVTGLLFVAFFLLRGIFDAGLIAAGDKSVHGDPPTFAEAVRAGVAGMWAIIGLNLIFAAFAIIVALSIIGIAGVAFGGTLLATFIGTGGSAHITEGWEVFPAAGFAIAAVIALIVVAVPVGLVLGLTIQLAQRAAVLEGQSLGRALATGWRIVRTAPGSLVRLVLGQLLVGIGVNIVVAIVVGVTVVPGALTMLSGGAQDGLFFAAMAVVLFVLAWLVSSVVLALPTAWNSLLWTIFYRAATETLPQDTTRPAPYSGQYRPV